MHSEASSANGRRLRLTYLVSHAIQYHAPFLREINSNPEIDLQVLFRLDIGHKGYIDPGFRRFTKWDNDLLGGYRSQVLPALFDRGRVSFLVPWNLGLFRHLRERKPDAIWIHGFASLYHLYAMTLAKILGIKVLLRDDAHERRIARNIPRQIVSRVLFVFLRRLADGFLCVGSANRQYYRVRGIPERKLFFAPNIVDNAFFELRSDAALTREEGDSSLRDRDRPPVVILLVAKLIPGKRCSDLLGALSLVAREKPAGSFVAHVVGDGPERPRLERQAEELGLAGLVRFEGFKNQSELRAYYRDADIMVLPSETESWGLCVNEAMAAGCAIVVSSAVVSADDLVTSGNGIVHKIGNVPELANALLAYMNDPARLAAAKRTSAERISTWGVRELAKGVVDAVRAVLAAPEAIGQ